MKKLISRFGLARLLGTGGLLLLVLLFLASFMIQRKKAARVYHPVKYPFITIRENVKFQYRNCEALIFV